MNLQQTRLGLVLNEAGVELAVTTFDQRLILQKSIHLLQDCGVNLGYHFRWYLRGPYSPRLTEDVFAIANLPDRGATDLRQWNLDEPSRARVTKFKSLMQALPANKLAKWLELLSSVLFLIRTGQAKAADTAGITSILHQNNKKHLSETEVREGLATLKRHGFAV